MNPLGTPPGGTAPDARRGLPRPIAVRALLASVCFALACAFVPPAGAQSLRFADGLTYNDFFTVTVHFEDGDEFTLFDAAALDGDSLPWPDAEGNLGDRRGAGPADEMKYFFWIRRMGDTGALTYPLPFRRIREIRFTGPSGGIGGDAVREGSLTVGDETREVKVRVSGDRFSGWIGDFPPDVPSFVPVDLVLSDGTEQKVMLKTDGFLGGIDEEFGTYALLWLKSDGILGLEFLHDGTYSRCPECGAVFYDEDAGACPFDGTELVPSLPR